MTKLTNDAPLSDLPVEAPAALPAAEVLLSPSAGLKNDCENVVVDADRRPADRVRGDSTNDTPRQNAAAADANRCSAAGSLDEREIESDMSRRADSPLGRSGYRTATSNPPNEIAPFPSSPAPTGALSSCSESTAKSAHPPFRASDDRGRNHAGEPTVRQAPSLLELKRALLKTGELLRDRAKRDIDNNVDVIVGMKLLQFEGAGQMEIRAYQHFYTDLWLKSQHEVEVVQ